MSNIKSLLETAQKAAIEAGKAIMEIYRSGDFSVELKKDESPVTIADREAHRIISEVLRETRLPLLSEEGMHEAYADRQKWEYYWLIDPLDGTKEFISKNDEFTVNIALMRQSQPIGGVLYIPCRETLYYGSAETGVYRIEEGSSVEIPELPKKLQMHDILKKEHVTIIASRSHLSPETKAYIHQFKNSTLVSSGSSLKFMLLAEGKADIYPRLGRTMEWDTAAAHAILNACNRGIYQMDLSSELSYNKEDLANPYFIAF